MLQFAGHMAGAYLPFISLKCCSHITDSEIINNFHSGKYTGAKPGEKQSFTRGPNFLAPRLRAQNKGQRE